MGRRSPMRKPPPYAHWKRARHGGPGFWYFTCPGYPRVRLPGLPWTPQFMEAYERAMNGAPVPVGGSLVVRRSFAELAAKFTSSAEWSQLAPATKTTYRRVIDRLAEAHGKRLIRDLERRHVKEKVLLPFAQTPSMSNKVLKVLRVMLNFAVELDWIQVNPAATVKPLKIKSEGFHTWSEAEIAQFEARWPIGTRERLAFALMLYLGQRRSDVAKLGPQHIEGGKIRLRQQKTGTPLLIPLHPELVVILEATPIGALAFIVSGLGKPYTVEAFGNWFRDACRESGLTDCPAHGLRKAASRRLAEADCTPHQIKAITGHKTLSEVTRYTDAANQARMAEQAIQKVVPLRSRG